MISADCNNQLITGLDVREFFQDSVQSALSNQHVSVCDETVIYVVNLLTVFVRTERLYESTSDGIMIKPLALIYGEALEAQSTSDRDNALKKLGDIALFISGLFANSLSRSAVDVDYYIALGGNAYGHLAGSSRVSRNGHVLKDVYVELAERFAEFVDVLTEVGEQSNLNSSSDIVRLYEIWLCSGSNYAADKLRKSGIYPMPRRRITH